MNEPETRNSATLKDFIAYCKAHPEERFWQALSRWAQKEIYFMLPPEDTKYGRTPKVWYVSPFQWEGKDE